MLRQPLMGDDAYLGRPGTRATPIEEAIVRSLRDTRRLRTSRLPLWRGRLGRRESIWMFLDPDSGAITEVSSVVESQPTLPGAADVEARLSCA